MAIKVRHLVATQKIFYCWLYYVYLQYNARMPMQAMDGCDLDHKVE